MRDRVVFPLRTQRGERCGNSRHFNHHMQPRPLAEFVHKFTYMRHGKPVRAITLWCGPCTRDYERRHPQ